MTNSDTTFTQLLAENQILVADGGMGSILLEHGLAPGECPEVFNIDQPDVIAGIHHDYVSAGAEIILTNTFGGTAIRLEHFGFEGRVDELNRAGVTIARDVANAADHRVAVAGSVGPIGQLFAPLGPLDAEKATVAFTGQIEALAAAGVDVVWIETLSSMEELSAAYAAGAASGLPVVTTMSFDSHGRTMMGVPPAKVAAWALSQPTLPSAIGANCGIGSPDVVAAVNEMHGITGDLALVAKANCGLPTVSADFAVEYPERPEDMSGYVEAAISAGARIIGACCGSFPAHIEAIRAAVDDHQL